MPLDDRFLEEVSRRQYFDRRGSPDCACAPADRVSAGYNENHLQQSGSAFGAREHPRPFFDQDGRPVRSRSTLANLKATQENGGLARFFYHALAAACLNEHGQRLSHHHMVGIRHTQ